MNRYIVNGIGKGSYKSRGSKFFAFTQSVDSLDSYKHLISVYRSEYPESCHVCSAYRILVNQRLDEYASDDGEPKGSSGQPILNHLKRHELVNTATYVIRVFGGSLLGIPGLIDAYSSAALLSIDDVKKSTWKEKKIISFDYNYQQKRIVESLIKEFSPEIIKHDFLEKIHIELSIESKKVDSFREKLKELSSGKIK